MSLNSYEERALAGKRMKADVVRLDNLYAEFATSSDMADQVEIKILFLKN